MNEFITIKGKKYKIMDYAHENKIETFEELEREIDLLLKDNSIDVSKTKISFDPENQFEFGVDENGEDVVEGYYRVIDVDMVDNDGREKTEILFPHINITDEEIYRLIDKKNKFIQQEKQKEDFNNELMEKIVEEYEKKLENFVDKINSYIESLDDYDKNRVVEVSFDKSLYSHYTHIDFGGYYYVIRVSDHPPRRDRLRSFDIQCIFIRDSNKAFNYDSQGVDLESYKKCFGNAFNYAVNFIIEKLNSFYKYSNEKVLENKYFSEDDYEFNDIAHKDKIRTLKELDSKIREIISDEKYPENIKLYFNSDGDFEFDDDDKVIAYFKAVDILNDDEHIETLYTHIDIPDEEIKELVDRINQELKNKKEEREELENKMEEIWENYKLEVEEYLEGINEELEELGHDDQFTVVFNQSTYSYYTTISFGLHDYKLRVSDHEPWASKVNVNCEFKRRTDYKYSTGSYGVDLEEFEGCFDYLLVKIKEFVENQIDEVKSNLAQKIEEQNLLEQSEIQSLIFSKDKFTKEKAKNWAMKHDFKYSKIDEKPNTIRIRQQSPDKYKLIRTIKLTDGVYATVGIKNIKEDKGKNNDLIPPKSVAKEAERGLKLREKYKRGGTLVGLKRANQLASRSNLSPETVKRMYSFFKRHEKNKDSVKDDGSPGNGKIAWKLWGGDAGKLWASEKWKNIKSEDE